MTSLSAVHIDPIGSQGRLYYGLKRGLDIILALFLGILSLPLIVVVALSIRLESSGPVLFRQSRVTSRRVRTPGGFKWELYSFSLLKFRTMEHNADPTVHREYISAYIQGNDDDLTRAATLTTEGTYKMVRDPRITRVGRVIRALSIDELPQLWNVLRGEMSLVGPRPPIDYEVELYDHRHLLRFAATQGLTGWWQVSGRATTGFEDMVDIDLDYIERQSLSLDLWILALTIPAVLLRKGAG
jgi:lipopolysaccharide/colanic/teichoic acid biosynthesis glycosyltransferase